MQSHSRFLSCSLGCSLGCLPSCSFRRSPRRFCCALSPALSLFVGDRAFDCIRKFFALYRVRVQINVCRSPYRSRYRSLSTSLSVQISVQVSVQVRVIRVQINVAHRESTAKIRVCSSGLPLDHHPLPISCRLTSSIGKFEEWPSIRPNHLADRFCELSQRLSLPNNDRNQSVLSALSALLASQAIRKLSNLKAF